MGQVYQATDTKLNHHQMLWPFERSPIELSAPSG